MSHSHLIGGHISYGMSRPRTTFCASIGIPTKREFEGFGHASSSSPLDPILSNSNSKNHKFLRMKVEDGSDCHTTGASKSLLLLQHRRPHRDGDGHNCTLWIDVYFSGQKNCRAIEKLRDIELRLRINQSHCGAFEFQMVG
jgi:hypothetical protein